MIHSFWHAFEDTLKIVPFLYIAFLIIEFIEHRLNKKNRTFLINSQKYGPFVGGILGMIPQCGFSALATNLFSSRLITTGTLIAVYLSTSDEMMMILLTGGMSFERVISIITLKASIAIIFGLLIDLFLRKKVSLEDKQVSIEEMCEHDDCHCHQNLFLASLKHTLSITLYIFTATFLINLLVHHLETATIAKVLLQGTIFSYFIISLIGLIPNCASSVMISELYLNNIISFGNMMGGLLTASGVGILILCRTNKNFKQNISIILLIYIIGIIAGFIIDLIGLSL